MLITTDQAVYAFLPGLGLLINSELKDEFNHLLPGKLDEKKFISKIKKDFSEEELSERLSSIRSIALNLTENCNFRCKYCVYSGNYEKIRTHSNKRMSFNTAQKVIDLLIKLITDKRRKLKTNSISIAFYGGEPLLEINLIKAVIEYTTKKFHEAKIDHIFKADFRISTNGYLINHQILDFLVNMNVKLDISLDGPQEEHDKFRLTREGEKTWKIIMNNLEVIKKKYPGYYENNVSFLCTLHPFHDYERIDKFFLDNPDFYDFDLFRIYPVKMDLLKESIKKNIIENA